MRASEEFSENFGGARLRIQECLTVLEGCY